MDVPAGTAAVKPANWVWKDPKFVLPILMPKWLGQVRYRRGAADETYEFTNLLSDVELKSLRLRTERTGLVTVTVFGRSVRVRTGPDGTVDVGRMRLGKKPVDIRIKKE